MLYKDPAITTNKKVACLWANDVEGNDRRRFFTPQLARDGFAVVDAGGFQSGMEDWSTVINQFKGAGCEILQGLMIPPDWGVFWKQCYQLSWVPKICDIGIQTLFPETMSALGDTGYGMAGPSWWHPLNPFKSSLTGETCAELALSYEKTTGNQWSQPIEHYMLFEWAVDAIKRTKNVDDKEEVIKNVSTTKMDTIVGPIDFTTPVETGTTKVGVRSFPNICSSVMWNGQWIKGTKQYDWDTKLWPYDLQIVEASDVGGYLKIQSPPIVVPGTTFK